jgi:hypothetical protein
MDYDCDRCINDCYLDNQQVDLSIPECILCLDKFRIQCQFGPVTKSAYKEIVWEEYMEKKKIEDSKYKIGDSNPTS